MSTNKKIKTAQSKPDGYTLLGARAFCWAVTGTFHGSIIEAETEGEARRIFHRHYNGESITHIKKRNVPAWPF
jgi:hypothetical protein